VGLKLNKGTCRGQRAADLKICIVSQTFAPQEEGGAEISARLGAVQLGQRHDVTVLALGKAGDPVAPTGERQLPGGIRLVRIQWNNTYLPLPRKSSVGLIRRAGWHLRTALGAVCPQELTQFLIREKFDLIYAQNSSYMQPALFIAARQANVPICLHLRDYGLLCPKTSMFRNGQNCERPCFDCSLLKQRVSSLNGSGMTVIAVSEALRQRFADTGLLQDAKWHVMHNTNAAESSFETSLVGRREPKSKTFTFGYLGAISEEKGIGDLLQAFSSVCDKNDARLVLAGRGRENDVKKLKKRAAGKAVEFTGFVPPENVYRQADVMVLPSRWHEPQSRILIEAPIYGLPVIGTMRGGTTEIINQNQTGWLYDPDQPGALANLLTKAIEIGQEQWWKQRDTLFPGIANFKGTAEQSDYYGRLEAVLLSAAAR
jgi:glycosyltransferase involved in cell wall biosynthesis